MIYTFMNYSIAALSEGSSRYRIYKAKRYSRDNSIN